MGQHLRFDKWHQPAGTEKEMHWKFVSTPRERKELYNNKSNRKVATKKESDDLISTHSPGR
jgi:hypothetical protein